MFDAYRRARDATEQLIRTEYASVLAELSTNSKPIREVYRVSNPANPVYPAAVVGTPLTAIDDSGSASVKSKLRVPVMLALSGSDPERLDADMDLHITAAVRLFAGREWGDFLFSPDTVDPDVPWPEKEGSSNYIHTAVVYVTAEVVESRN